MESKIIELKINDDEIKITSSNPELKKLVEIIVKQDDNFDFDSIEITCDDENFDIESFKKIIVDSIINFKEKLVINEINLTKEEENINNLEVNYIVDEDNFGI